MAELNQRGLETFGQNEFPNTSAPRIIPQSRTCLLCDPSRCHDEQMVRLRFDQSVERLARVLKRKIAIMRKEQEPLAMRFDQRLHVTVKHERDGRLIFAYAQIAQ